MKKTISLLTGIFSATLFFTSCSSDRDRVEDGDRGPASSSSFAGTSISFNPTLTFFPGGRIEWVNEETGTQFIEAPASDPLEGVFNYEPTGDFRSGILTVTLDGETQQLFDIGQFVTVNGMVKSFTINFNGLNFIATVSGDLVAAEDPDDNNNGGGGNSDDFTFRPNGNLTAGTTFSRDFLASNPQGDVSNSPLLDYNNGETVDFRIADDGSLLFDGVGGQLSPGFVAATDDGIISYQEEVNGGVLAVTFSTEDDQAGSDFTIIWTGPTDIFNPGAPAIDNRVFANQ